MYRTTGTIDDKISLDVQYMCFYTYSFEHYLHLLVSTYRGSHFTKYYEVILVFNKQNLVFNNSIAGQKLIHVNATAMKSR